MRRITLEKAKKAVEDAKRTARLKE